MSSCSQEWIEAIRAAEETSASCGFCRRLNVAVSGDAGLARGWEIRAEKDGVELCVHDAAALQVGELEGRAVVVDCSCERLALAEAFVWTNREVILRYLGARAEKEMKEAQQLLGAVANVELKGAEL